MKHLSLLSGILGLAFCGAASAADITIFHSPSCPHCHHAREFISSSLIYEYPTLKVTEVNVANADNRDMFLDALKKCKYDNGGVPVLVVGEKCFQGYADFMQSDLRNAVAADLSDSDKEIAAANQAEMKKDADAFRAAHADRAGAIVEYGTSATEPAADVQKKTNESPILFYVILVALVAGLGFVLIRKDKKN